MRRRLTRFLFGTLLLAVSAACAWVVLTPFDTRFAEKDLACEAPVQEAFPEDRPNEPGADEITYAELTNDPSIAVAFRNRMINFFEEKACGDEARSRAYRAVPLGLIALSVGSGAVASAFRREKDPVRKAMRDVQKQAKKVGL